MLNSKDWKHYGFTTLISMLWFSRASILQAFRPPWFSSFDQSVKLTRLLKIPWYLCFTLSKFTRARIWAVMEMGEKIGWWMRAALQIQSRSPKNFWMYWHPHRCGMLYILTSTQNSHCEKRESVFVFTNESFVFGFAQNLWSVLLTVEKPRHASIVAQSHPMPIADIHHSADTIT